MSLVFYEAKYSSATPVLAALLELDIPFEHERIDLAEAFQRSEAFLALNPNGKVPTIVVDGTPMFEALAIMSWLGERYGVEKGLWPAADSTERMEVMSWAAWAYVSYGGVLNQWAHTTSERYPEAFRNPALAEASKAYLEQMLGVLDRRLGEGPYFFGERFSLLDVIVSGAVGYGMFCGVTLEAHPRARAWLERCQARPASQRSMR